MRNIGSRGGGPLDFTEALALGYPPAGGIFLPETVLDLRQAVYSPASEFADFLAVAATELLPELLDPFTAPTLLSRAFQPQPRRHEAGEGLLVFDLAGGATGSTVDYSASFAAALIGRLEAASDVGIRPLGVAAANPREAAALASAFGRLAPDLDLLLLLPRGGAAVLAPFLGRGRVRCVEVGGSLGDALALERGAAAAGRLGGRPLYPLGTATPLRLLGRSLLLMGLFSQARRGISGDLIVCLPPGDLLALVTALWTWSWGLPVSSFLLASRPGEAWDLGTLLSEAVPPEESAAQEALVAFDGDLPLASLVHSLGGGADPGLGPAALEDGLELDLGTRRALATAQAALDRGLSGHSTILVPRTCLPVWDRPFSGEVKDLRAAAGPLDLGGGLPAALGALDAAVPRLFA